MIDICPTHMVDSVWLVIRDGMKKACEKGGQQFTEDGLHLICRRGDAYLVLMTEEDKVAAAVVVQPQQWASRQILHILAAHVLAVDRQGDWWGPMVDWGKGAFPGCSALVFEGRPRLGENAGSEGSQARI